MGEPFLGRIPVEIWERIFDFITEGDYFFSFGSRIQSFGDFVKFGKAGKDQRKISRHDWASVRTVCRAWKSYIDAKTLFIDGQWIHESPEIWSETTILNARRISYNYSVFDPYVDKPSRWSIVEMELRTTRDISSFRTLAAFSSQHPIRRLLLTIFQALGGYHPSFISDLSRFNHLLHLSIVDHSEPISWWPSGANYMLELPRLEALEWSVVGFPYQFFLLPSLRHLYLRLATDSGEPSVWNQIRSYSPNLISLELDEFYVSHGYTLYGVPWARLPKLEELGILLRYPMGLGSQHQLPPSYHPLQRLYLRLPDVGLHDNAEMLHGIIKRLSGGLKLIRLARVGPGKWSNEQLEAFRDLSRFCSEHSVSLEDGDGAAIPESNSDT